MASVTADGACVVIITGGGGFLGQSLASSLLSDPRVTVHRRLRLLNAGDRGGEEESDGDGIAPEVVPVARIVLADVAFPPRADLQPAVSGGIDSGSVLCRVGSVSDPSFCTSLFEEEDGDGDSRHVSVFHLGAVMSGTGEADFDLCVDVNLRGTMNMLESARDRTAKEGRKAGAGAGAASVVKFVYASAGATIGSGDPTDHISGDGVVADSSRASPHTTYGMTKAVGELLVSDYGRRGFVDGRGVRLPTVAVRAGRPNAATTGCFSAVVREPMAGVDAPMPISAGVRHAVTGVRNVVEALRTMHDVSPEAVRTTLGYDRTVFLPAAALSLSDLQEAVMSVVEPSCVGLLGKVDYDGFDPFLSEVVGSFPTKIDASRATKMGIGPAPTAEGLVRDYAESFPDALADGLKLRPIRDDSRDSDEGRRGSGETAAAAAAGHSDRENSNIVAVITGGGSGIGRAVALRLVGGGWGPNGTRSEGRVCLVLAGRGIGALRETADLIVAADERRRQSNGGAGGATAAPVEVRCVPTDVTDEGAVRDLFSAAVSDFGRVDLLFNNAGTNRGRCDAVDFPSDDFNRIIGANLTGAFLVAREAMGTMSEQTPRGGRIINNGSVSADRPRPGGVAYTMSKHAVTGLTKTLALEGRSLDIAVGQIDFGNVTTAVSDLTQKTGGGALQADGSLMQEPQMLDEDAANTVHCMAALPLGANVLHMTVMATKMPLVGRG